MIGSIKLSIKMYVRAVGVSFLVSFLLAGCGGSGSSSDAQLSQIVGVWGDGNNDDVEYIVIDSVGTLSFYDYQADAFGTGENCYLIESLDDDFQSVSVSPSGSNFDIIFRDSEFNGIIENSISVSADGETFSLWTEIDDDSARLGSNPNTVIIPADRNFEPVVVQRVQGVAQADLNACTGSAAIQNDDSGFSTNTSSSSFKSTFKALLREFGDQFNR